MNIQKDVLLSDFSTFRTGGMAKLFFRVKNLDEIKDGVSFAKKGSLPIFVLGGGSNILISDSGFDGLVLKNEIKGIEREDLGDFVELIVGAGEDWDNFVYFSVNEKLSGLENLSGIPGTVGGAPVQNIGAYGAEVSSVINWVEVFDIKEETVKKFDKISCEFDYRDSIFKKEKGRFIILRVSFLLSKKFIPNISYRDVSNCLKEKGNINPTILDVRNIVLEIRKNKLPDVKEIGSAGSFFKNPILDLKTFNLLKEKFVDLPSFDMSTGRKKIALAWILDKVCDLKNYKSGNVSVYKNQPIVLVNLGKASSSEIRKVSEEIINLVNKKAGIIIEPEVNFVGEF